MLDFDFMSKCPKRFKLNFLVVFYFLANLPLFGQHRFEVNLNRLFDGKLEITCYPQKIKSSLIKYNLPAIVPGTYSVYDFGRYVSDFKAFNEKGQALEVIRESVNSWLIKNSTELSKISYRVEDTWDSPISNLVFEPAGSSFEADKVFVINPHALFGYFDEQKNLPYQISFTKPPFFYGSTSLKRVGNDSIQDVFQAENYMLLADSPILYCRPDTTLLKVGETEIMVSVYSPNRTINSAFISKEISSLLAAQKEYLGGKLPIQTYTFLFFFTDKTPRTGLVGALEHSYSSFYYLIETSLNAELIQAIKDIAAHEFFHILTPLSIHSQEIHDFDFLSPKMSKHLWLYEGTVEYAASHMQVKQGLISQAQYLKVLEEKISAASNYQKNLSFTELSQFCLDKHKRQYGNVYEKGALIAASLDILLLENSQGQYSLQSLMKDLSHYYGKDRPFVDDELFDKIAEIANQPSLREFFAEFVEGSRELDYESIFSKVGLQYLPLKTVKVVNLGRIEIRNRDSYSTITKIYTDRTTKKIGYKLGDVLLEINGKKVSSQNLQECLEGYLPSKNTAIVLRNGEKIKLNLPRKPQNKTIKNHLAVWPSASDAQKKLLRHWLSVEQH
jgi:predicted metalloprotease with PDZ domain